MSEKHKYEHTTRRGFKIITEAENEAEAAERIRATVRLIGEYIKPVRTDKKEN